MNEAHDWGEIIDYSERTQFLRRSVLWVWLLRYASGLSRLGLLSQAL